LRDVTFREEPLKQIIVTKKIFMRPFGTKSYPTPKSSPNELVTVADLFAEQRSEMACVHKLWQYLTSGVDRCAEQGGETEFVASFMVRFLIDECASVWPARMAYILQLTFQKLWSTSWGPIAILNHIQSDEDTVWLIGLSRQAPKAMKASLSDAGRYNAKLETGKEMQRRQATIACIVLYHTPLGRDLFALLRSFAPYRWSLGLAMALSFLLCELRKNADTGSTRFRESFPAATRATFYESMAAQFPHLTPTTISLRHKGETWKNFLKTKEVTKATYAKFWARWISRV
jgi:hypothetical protein